jgi:hypothetical protein
MYVECRPSSSPTPPLLARSVGANFASHVGETRGRVTRGVCEKITQNVAQKPFFAEINSEFLTWKN